MVPDGFVQHKVTTDLAKCNYIRFGAKSACLCETLPPIARGHFGSDVVRILPGEYNAKSKGYLGQVAEK